MSHSLGNASTIPSDGRSGVSSIGTGRTGVLTRL